MSGTVAHVLPANGGAGRRIYLREIQAAEGTAATLSDADYGAALSFGVTPAHTSVPRRTVSPEQAGNRPLSTMNHAKVAAQVEIIPRTISSANDSDAPSCDAELRMGGWARTSDSTDKTHTYVLVTAPSEVGTVAEVQLNADNTRYVTVQAQDVRCSSVIEGRAGEEITVTLDGLGPLSSPSSGTAPRPATGSAWSGTLTDPTGQPMVLEGCTIKVWDPAAGEMYAGGSLASPGTAGDLLAFRLDATRAISARTGASAAQGIHGALGSPAGATLTLELEANAADVFSLHTKKASNTPLFFSVRGTQRGTTNTMTLVCWFAITDLDETAVSDSRYIASITASLLYPPDVSDNSPTAGSSPTQAIGAATNYGLPLMPSTTLPKGLAFLQFATP